MRLISYFQTFTHPSPQWHISLSCSRTHSSNERAAIFRREQKFRWGWRHWSRLQGRSSGVNPYYRNQKKKTSKTWSEIMVSQNPMPSFWHRDSSSGICKIKVSKSQVRESVTSVLQAFSPVNMGFVSAKMWPVFSKQLESPVTPSVWSLFIGTSPRSLKTVLLHNENMYMHLFTWHTRCSSKTNRAASIHC